MMKDTMHVVSHIRHVVDLLALGSASSFFTESVVPKPKMKDSQSSRPALYLIWFKEDQRIVCCLCTARISQNLGCALDVTHFR